MKRTIVILTIIFVVFLPLCSQSRAEEALPAKPYSGDIWHRSTLTGDWFGVRNDLAAKGITFDMSLTQVYQGILSGGKDIAWKYGQETSQST
jgi:hypothetical protein